MFELFCLSLYVVSLLYRNHSTHLQNQLISNVGEFMLLLVVRKLPNWELNLNYPNVDAVTQFSVYSYKDLMRERENALHRCSP